MAPVRFQCSKCVKSCGRKYDLKRHEKTSCGTVLVNNSAHRCSVCTAKFSREDNLNRHLRNKHTVKIRGTKQSALGGVHQCIVIEALGQCFGPLPVPGSCKGYLWASLQADTGTGGDTAHRARYLIWWSAMEVSMEKPLGEQCTAHFTHKKRYVFPESDFVHELEERSPGDCEELWDVSRTWVWVGIEKC